VPAKKTPAAKTPSSPTTPAPARPRTRRTAASADASAEVKPRPRRVAKTAPIVEPAAVQTVPAVQPQRRPVSREDIQVRAYFLALEHGGKGGSLDYWLLAEQELTQSGASGD
jgi:hypothetical protein